MSPSNGTRVKLGMQSGRQGMDSVRDAVLKYLGSVLAGYTMSAVLKHGGRTNLWSVSLSLALALISLMTRMSSFAAGQGSLDLL